MDAELLSSFVVSFTRNRGAVLGVASFGWYGVFRGRGPVVALIVGPCERDLAAVFGRPAVVGRDRYYCDCNCNSSNAGNRWYSVIPCRNTRPNEG